MSVSEAPSNSIRRRPRPILSCLECRRKKLGCDRKAPCNQCVKAERAELCAYEAPRKSQRTSEDHEAHRHDDYKPASPSDTSVHAPNSSAHLGIIEDLQRRVAKLESAVEQRPEPSSPHRTVDRPDKPTKQGTSYYGAQYAPFASRHSIFLFEPFTEAKKFLMSMHKDPSVKPFIERLQRWNEQYLGMNGGTQDRQDADGAVSHMLALLPPRGECDELVRAYFANSERTLRVLHRPTFLQIYEQFFKTRAGDSSDAEDRASKTGDRAIPEGFVPQLIAVLAASCNTDRLYGHRIRPTNLAAPASKSALCELVQTWLNRLGRKDRMRLDTLQTQIILTLSQHNIFLPNDLTWQATGALVRRAMLLGLHRDPGESLDYTPLEIEMRRRLWATVIEMDLQASMVWGMPSTIGYANYNTRAPANLDDSDLSSSMTHAPVARDPDQWSDNLLQNILARSLPLRLRVGNFLNDMRQELDPERRQRLGREIEDLLASVPAVALPNMYEPTLADEAAADRPGRLLGRILLDLSLRRVLLYIYRPFAMDFSDSEIFYRARRICRDSALAILSHKDAFQPQTAVGDFDGAEAAEYWTLFSTTCRHDVLLAALSLCWEIRMISSARNKDLGDSRGPGGGAWTKTKLTRVAEDAVASLMQQSDMSTSFFKDVVGCSIILESVKFEGSEEERLPLLQRKLVDILEKLLSRLERNLNGTDYSSPPQEDFTLDVGQYFSSFNLEFVSIYPSSKRRLMSIAPPRSDL